MRVYEKGLQRCPVSTKLWYYREHYKGVLRNKYEMYFNHPIAKGDEIKEVQICINLGCNSWVGARSRGIELFPTRALVLLKLFLPIPIVGYQ